MSKSPLKVKDRWPKIKASIQGLTAAGVYVGIPAENAARDDDAPLNNAAIGYIHENGAPEVNIPARPWLVPGVKGAQKDLAALMRKAAKFAAQGESGKVGMVMHAAGIKAVSAVKLMISSNIQPALAEGTLAARRRRGVTRTNTLVDTGNLQNHINYVVKEKT
jgi:hypothetical protein